MKTARLPILLLLATLLPASSALAQSRTWVSGVGDDLNPCSRTAPCKTFASAISKTAAGGEIDVLDPGAFGAVTITKSISIVADHVAAGILAGGTNGIVINAGAQDMVVLRGITIEGQGTGLRGIYFIKGGSLHVQDCQIRGFTDAGVSFDPAAGGSLQMKDVVVRKSYGGVFLRSTGGVVAAALDGVTLEENTFYGIRAENGVSASVRNSVMSHNLGSGLNVRPTAGAALVSVEDSAIVGNAVFGIKVGGGGAPGEVRMNRVSLFNNATGIGIDALGTCASFGTNSISGNGLPSSPNASIALQ